MFCDGNKSILYFNTTQVPDGFLEIKCPGYDESEAFTFYVGKKDRRIRPQNRSLSAIIGQNFSLRCEKDPLYDVWWFNEKGEELAGFSADCQRYNYENIKKKKGFSFYCYQKRSRFDIKKIDLSHNNTLFGCGKGLLYPDEIHVYRLKVYEDPDTSPPAPTVPEVRTSPESTDPVIRTSSESTDPIIKTSSDSTKSSTTIPTDLTNGIALPQWAIVILAIIFVIIGGIIGGIVFVKCRKNSRSSKMDSPSKELQLTEDPENIEEPTYETVNEVPDGSGQMDKIEPDQYLEIRDRPPAKNHYDCVYNPNPDHYDRAYAACPGHGDNQSTFYLHLIDRQPVKEFLDSEDLG